MKKINCLLALLWITGVNLPAQDLRAPAYPLITHNPYLSIWSFGDCLNESATRHWTGEEHSLTGFIKVDGQVYRFLGRQPRQYITVLPAADEERYSVRYTEKIPGHDWTRQNFDDGQWNTGGAPFSDDKAQASTLWQSDNLWFRREFTLDDKPFKKLYLKLRHDDNVKVFINGEKIYDFNGWKHSYKYIPIDDRLAETLKEGTNILAIHCRNTAGGQWLDAGLVIETPSNEVERIMAAEQTSVTLNATQTIYEFKCGKTDVTATFTSPLLLEDIDVLSRPVSYISVKVQPNDNKVHDVQLYLGTSGLLAVNTPNQELLAEKYKAKDLAILKAGTVQQPVLKRKGDGVRIDWGYVYVAAPASSHTTQYISSVHEALTPFLTSSEVPARRENEGRNLMLNTIVDLKEVDKKGKEQVFMIGYDELYSVQYFDQKLKPWWKKKGDGTIETTLKAAYDDYKKIIKNCEAFDEEMYAMAKEAGGKKYADLCELAYRQAIAAHILLESENGEILFLSKENHSNGSINTVDVTYPSAPLFLLYNPDLVKGMLNGIFYYTESGRWKKPFPAHDLGTYPIATGQTYGEDMPVEEAGNMIILTAAIAAVEGDAAYAKKHWETLTLWAEYLSESGFDPANQLSTDDFAGHLARNANLSIKAIMALASYGKLAGMLGKDDIEQQYISSARDMAGKWMKLADDGNHYTLAFEKKNTWSQKYNLAWDDILGLHIFPEQVVKTEMEFYLNNQNRYGLPLDSRKTYTKSDWILWTATLADNDEDFRSLVAPVWQYANDTPDRVPLSDWHETTDAEVMNFRARSVVGGYFIKLLEDEMKAVNYKTRRDD